MVLLIGIIIVSALAVVDYALNELPKYFEEKIH